MIATLALSNTVAGFSQYFRNLSAYFSSNESLVGDTGGSEDGSELGSIEVATRDVPAIVRALVAMRIFNRIIKQ